ncbi:T9SS type A sorting domain-containing protein [candidate division KSB1 bacterium]|nr:T9SS type A sorting domain-containing protein [candidate division KSB1 bacterium]
MKTYLFAALLGGLVSFVNDSLAQEVVWQNPLPSGNRIFRPQFPVPDCGFAMSIDRLVRSSDHGRTWDDLGPLPRWQTDGDFTTLSFVDCEHGWCGRNSWSEDNGWGCEVWGTANHGEAWTEVDHAGFMRVTKLSFLSETEGWMVGSDSIDSTPAVLAHTTDGGQSWWRQLSFDGAYSIDFEMHDSGCGWLSDLFALYRTTDRGATWQVVYPDGVYCFSFVDDSLGWGVEPPRGEVVRSTNGGLDWTLRAELNLSNWAYDVLFLNPAVGLIAGNSGPLSGQIRRTGDGGLTWRNALSGRDRYPAIFDVLKVDGYRLFATGYGGIRLISEDAGQTWSEAGSSATWAEITAVEFDGVRGFAVTSTSELLRTRNGGQTWHVNLELGRDHPLYDVQLMDQVAYACGEGLFLHTADGGDSWDTLSADDRTYVELSFINARQGWRIVEFQDSTSLALAIESTADYGRTWDTQFSGNTNGGIGAKLEMINELTGWALLGRSSGGLMRTVDGWANWTWQEIPGASSLGSFDAIDSATVWLGAGRGIWVSHDGGQNWDSVSAAPQYSSVTDVDFYDSELGAIGLTGGGVMVTTNGGLTWSHYDARIFGGRTYVKMTESGLVLVGSAYGSLFSVRFGEGTSEVHAGGAPLPQSISLLCFPNPFNPATQLRLELAVAERVTVAIYDLTGRLVETLADEVMQPGPHSFTWSADKFTSGIYFARLVTPTQAVTSKLVLLR